MGGLTSAKVPTAHSVAFASLTKWCSWGLSHVVPHVPHVPLGDFGVCDPEKGS